MITKFSPYLMATVVWLSLMTVVNAAEEPILLDFSHSHHLDDILKSGLKLTNFTDQESKEKSFSITPNQNILVRLPRGLEIQEKITGGWITADNEGELMYLDIHGQTFPENEMYELAKEVHQAFGISLERLDAWRAKIHGYSGSRAGFDTTYSNGNQDYYPNIFFEARQGWWSYIEMAWKLDDEKKKRDEKWGEAYNPRPPAGLEHLSLNSKNCNPATPKPSYWYLWLLLLLLLLAAFAGAYWLMTLDNEPPLPSWRLNLDPSYPRVWSRVASGIVAIRTGGISLFIVPLLLAVGPHFFGQGDPPWSLGLVVTVVVFLLTPILACLHILSAFGALPLKGARVLWIGSAFYLLLVWVFFWGLSTDKSVPSKDSYNALRSFFLFVLETLAVLVTGLISTFGRFSKIKNERIAS